MVYATGTAWYRSLIDNNIYWLPYLFSAPLLKMQVTGMLHSSRISTGSMNVNDPQRSSPYLRILFLVLQF
jgi:hypothetical protein